MDADHPGTHDNTSDTRRKAPSPERDGLPPAPVKPKHGSRQPPPIGPQLFVYQRELSETLVHADAPIQGRRHLTVEGLALRLWLMRGSHVLLVSRLRGEGCVSEHLTDSRGRAVELNPSLVIPAIGERDTAHPFRQGIAYMNSVQSENLNPSVYDQQFNEIHELGRDRCRAGVGLVHRWSEPAGESMSVLDIVRRPGEFTVEAYHFRAHAGLVIRSQTLFEIQEHALAG